ncbi:hypothetical protein SDC9_46727 [bioreactor metagenome]|uniref:Copper amine oxidase-like N-terminal domain-containing protein n=1 Tax=bioreactor metagenome TaxID=1076179 RepID=A0A644WAJ5_9ZZZZ
MIVKKYLSLILAAVLSISLVVPALAVSEDSQAPLWKQLGYESLEQCVEEEYYGSEDAYYQDAGWAAWKAEYISAHPGEVNAFLANADTYFENDYWAGKYYTPEKFMESSGFATHEEFAKFLLDDWLYDTYYSVYLQEAKKDKLDNEKLTLGGVPGELSVILNGTYLSFPDAKPEASGGRIMVPFRPLLEGMGGTVSYDGNGTVNCVLNGATLTFSIGSDTVTVEKDGQTSRIMMDCTCYAKNDRTYVPVRFVSQAAGYDVYWDSDFQTAVIIDQDTVISQIDQNFTIVNRILAAQANDPDKKYKETGSAKLKLTIPDALNGEHVYSLTANVDSLQSAKVVNIAGSANLADLLALRDYFSSGSYTSDEDAAKEEELRTALADVDFSMIMNLSAGLTYLKMPLIALLSDGEYAAGDWFSIPQTDMSPSLGLIAASPSVGSLLYLGYRSKYEAFSSGSVYFYKELTGTDGAASLNAVLGDSKWTKVGSSYALHFGIEDYNTLMTEVYGSDASDMAESFDALEFSVTLKKNDEATYSFTIQPHSDYAVAAFKLTGSGTLSPTANTLVTKFEMTMLSAELEMNTARRVTDETPVSAPPAGANVVDY